MRNEKGVILTIVLIFVIILSIIAGVAILLMTNQARITESQIGRIRAFYTAQAAIIHALENLRKGISPPASETINANGGLTADIKVEASGAGTGPFNTRRITASVSY